MSDPTKKSLAISAMINLKAELHRKQEEFRRQKEDNKNHIKGRQVEQTKSKKSIWSQQNKGVASRQSKDVEEKDEEEEEDLNKSRRMLAHKARLYEEMTSTSNIPDEDGSEGFLVDFQKKAVDQIVEKREKRRRAEEEKEEDEAERKSLQKPVPEPENSDDEWVDYEDSFGRSKRCMRKDLDRLREKDQQMTRQKEDKKCPDTSKDSVTNAGISDLMSSDMHREKMREKWEAEARELMDKGQKDIHYSNVQFDEIRSHGVGFFQFSKDSQAREEQMEQLKKLRDETVQETSRKERIKDKRKAMMEARLAKVRDRRKLKATETDSSKDEEASKEAEEAARKAAEEEERKKKEEEMEREAAEVRRNHIREWDNEKQKNSWVGNGYLESRREEREAEFAPPSVYFDGSGKKGGRKSVASSDQSRIDRLRQMTGAPKVNPDFAPPPSYFTNQEKSIPGYWHNAGNVSSDPLSNGSSSQPTNQEAKDKKLKSYNYNRKDDDDKDNSTAAVLPSLDSIPLPGASDNLRQNNASSETQETVSPSHHTSDPGLNKNQGNYDWQYTSQSGHIGESQQPPWAEATSQYSEFPQQNPSHSHNPQPFYDGQGYQYPQHHHHYQQQSQHHQPPQPEYQQHLLQYHQPPQPEYQQHQPPQPEYQQQNYNHHTQPSGSKRQNTSQNQIHAAAAPSKKPKVPKNAILDTRFMQNSLQPTNEKQATTLTGEPSSVVEAVPYTPGSFTAARFGHDNPVTNYSAGDDTSTPESHISGGPKIYSKEQQEEQQRQLDDGDDEEADQKLQDFLSSIRAETS